MRAAKQHNQTLLINENKKTNKKINKELYKDYTNHVSLPRTEKTKEKKQESTPNDLQQQAWEIPRVGHRERKMKQAAVGLHRPCMYALVGLGLYL